jgi:hypothetical protein
MSNGPTDQSSTGDRIPAFVNAKAGSTASIRVKPLPTKSPS